MKSNRPNTSDMPSPTFTYATTCTVPRSSPLLSSSFTPFYPRSQQQLYNTQFGPPGNHDGGCHGSPKKSDDNNVDKRHSYAWSCARGPKFYDQQYYASSGSEPYEVSWISNNGNVWGSGAWQWDDSAPVEYAYADDDAEDSAYLLSDSLSYAESPALEQELYACSTSNIKSFPAPFHDRGATATFSAFHSSAMPEQASFLSKKENLTPSFRKLSTKEQAVSLCGSEKQGPAKGMKNEIANASTSSKLDAKPSSIQVSLPMCSSVGMASRAIEPKLKQATTDVAENKCSRTESSKLPKNSCNLSIEQGSVDATELKHSIYATSTPPNTVELMEGNLDSLTVSLPAEVIQKEVGSINSASFQSSHTQLQSNGGQCPSRKMPKPVNAQACCSPLVKIAPLEQMNKESLLNKAALVMKMEGKPCIEAIDPEPMHQDKMNSLPGDAGLCSTGPQLLVKSIHILSKVLLSSQSGTCLNILDLTDCLAIENTICMLSHRLSQYTVNEASVCQEQNCYQLQVDEQESKSSDDSVKFYKEAGSSEAFQKKSSRLLTSKIETVSPRRALENEALENPSKVVARSCVEGDERSDQSPSVKTHLEELWEELLRLQDEVRKLQEEVAYERAESNATVSTYKKLWSEAQQALKVSRSEMREISAELAGFKQEFKNLKHLEGSGGQRSTPGNHELTKYDMNTCIHQGGLYENFSDIASSSMAPDLRRASNGDGNGAFCGNSKEHLPESSEVLTGYFDPGNISYCRENWTPLSKDEKAILKHNNHVASSNQNGNKFELSTSEPSSKHTFGPPTNLEDEVTRRLSLLLARQGLDLNKTCTETSVESPSDSNTILEPLSNLSREGEAIPPDKTSNYLMWSETPYMVNANKGVGFVKADLSYQMKSDLELKRGHHGLVEREPNGRVDVEEVNASTCQEDEIEIICFKPGVADSSFTCLKGEPEWEHVVVNALDDHKLNGVTSRKFN